MTEADVCAKADVAHAIEINAQRADCANMRRVMHLDMHGERQMNGERQQLQSVNDTDDRIVIFFLDG